jgi:hypothetical protein
MKSFMISTNFAVLRNTFLVLLSSVLLIGVLVISLTATVTEEKAKLWKMWINLAIDGYADPLPLDSPATEIASE